MWSEKTFFAVLFVACVSATAPPAVDKKELKFSYITTITSDEIRASGGIPAVDLALEEIANSSFLANYTLSYTTVLDSKCTETGGLDAFFRHFKNDSQPTYVSLLCCGCSTATIPVAKISHHWNIAHLAYAAAASVLNDREKYRSFFRVLPSFDNLGPSVLAIMDEFNWTQMLVFTQDESLFVKVTEYLVGKFADNGWNLQNVLIPTGVEDFPYEEAFTWDGDMRIFYINSYPPQAFKLLCEASNRGLLSPTYVWILQGWYPDGWWKDEEDSTCTPDVMLAILNRSLVIIPDGYFPNEDKSARAISNRTSDEFKEEYDSLVNSPKYEDIDPLSVIGVAYDSVWAMAIGLDTASERVRTGNDSGCDHLPGDLVPLEEFDYSNAKMGCVLNESFLETSFMGITGDISFDSNGSRADDVILLMQYRVGKDLAEEDVELPEWFIADITILPDNHTFVYRSPEDSSTLWEGSIPYDGSPITNIVDSNESVVGVFYALASVGVIFTTCCLIFNIVLRNRKVVKLSSPNLNYFLITGAAMLYVSIYFYTYMFTEQTQTAFCNIRLCLFSLGYTLCFAVILAKTWRVYYIFSNPTTKKKAIKDWILMVIIGMVVGVDAILLLLGTSIPQTRLNATLVVDEENPTSVNDEGHNIENFVYLCSPLSTIVWMTILFSYKGLLQIVAMFMAFHIRKVRIKALNDAKEITIIVYINSLTLILLVVTEFALYEDYLVYSCLFALALFTGASIFLGLVFAPKAVSLLRDPEGKFVLTSTETDGFPQPSSIVQRRNSSLEYGRSLNLNKGNEPNISSSLDRKNSYQVNSPEPISLSIIKDDLGTHHEDDFIKDDLGTHHEDSKGSADQDTENVKL